MNMKKHGFAIGCVVLTLVYVILISVVFAGDRFMMSLPFAILLTGFAVQFFQVYGNATDRKHSRLYRGFYLIELSSFVVMIFGLVFWTLDGIYTGIPKAIGWVLMASGLFVFVFHSAVYMKLIPDVVGVEYTQKEKAVLRRENSMMHAMLKNKDFLKSRLKVLK